MLFDGKQTKFQSEIHEVIWALGRRIVPFDISTAEISDKDMLEGLRQVYDFTVELFSDMYANPDKYKLTNYSVFDTSSVNTESVGFFHEYLFQLLKTKKARLVDNDLEVKTDELNSFLSKRLAQLDLYAPIGILCENKDGITVIKSSKYPLFLKYYSMCFEASQKRKVYCRSYVIFCDFRVFNKRFSLTIDDMVRVLSDRDKAYLWEVHNHLVSKGIRLTANSYEYKKYKLLFIQIGLLIPLDLHVHLGISPYDEVYKLMINEIENLPNKDELATYLIDNIKCCNYCCKSTRDKSCGGHWWTFFDEERFVCQGITLGKYGDGNRDKYYNDHDIKMLKQFLDLRIKTIDSLTP